MTRFTSDEFNRLNLIKNADGTYSMQGKAVKNDKIKSVLPSKAGSLKERVGKLQDEINNYPDKVKWNPPIGPLRKLSLKLFGVPMPKQSVRSYATGKRTKKGIYIVDHFQPQKTVDRNKDYIKQITEQLPVDFKPFEKRVHITKMHFVFPPLKEFSKKKMNRIEAGEIIYKETRPDLPDNLKKLVNDSMSGIVYKDDNIIVSEDDVKKYYGTGGIILIDLEGY